MRTEEKAALDVLAKASDVHNCWAILDEAVTSGEDDQFTKEYIEGEREMLEGSIKGMIRALGALGGLYGIVASTQKNNGSYAFMRKVREEHLTELERAKEFDRGYRAGQRAMDAERQAIALKLRGLDLTGSSHENLSKIAYAIYPCATGWTPESCEGLRDKLVRLLGGVNERETTLTTCDVLDNERHKAICELRKMTIDSHYYGNYQRIALAIGATYDGERFASECVRDRLIHLLGGDVCEGGDHGDCAERRRAGAAGGDTDVLESTEIRAVSNGIADMLSRQGKVKFPPNEDGSLDSLKTVEETSVLIDDVKRRANQSHEFSPMRLENETGITNELREMDNGHSRTCPKSGDEVSESAPSVSIVDELRDCVERATKTYDDAAWYDVDDEDEHTWCSITVAEIDGIADRIEEQFARVCQQQEAVIQSTIELMAEENLTVKDERDYLRRQRDELQAKLDGIKSVLATDETEASDAC